MADLEIRPCSMCNGDGFHPDDGAPEDCPECGGEGTEALGLVESLCTKGRGGGICIVCGGLGDCRLASKRPNQSSEGSNG